MVKKLDFQQLLISSKKYVISLLMKKCILTLL